MKKIFILFSSIILLSVLSCDKSSSENTPNESGFGTITFKYNGQIWSSPTNQSFIQDDLLGLGATRSSDNSSINIVVDGFTSNTTYDIADGLYATFTIFSKKFALGDGDITITSTSIVNGKPIAHGTFQGIFVDVITGDKMQITEGTF